MVMCTCQTNRATYLSALCNACTRAVVSSCTDQETANGCRSFVPKGLSSACGLKSCSRWGCARKPDDEPRSCLNLGKESINLQVRGTGLAGLQGTLTSTGRQAQKLFKPRERNSKPPGARHGADWPPGCGLALIILGIVRELRPEVFKKTPKFSFRVKILFFEYWSPMLCTPQN